ncbi:hypothetical protein [uncultured Nitrosomonas sp.]|nr:hypothetical protein [uncultured Nitrosomonas sp.]
MAIVIDKVIGMIAVIWKQARNYIQYAIAGQLNMWGGWPACVSRRLLLAS